DLHWFDLHWFDLHWFDLHWFDLHWFDLHWFDLHWRTRCHSALHTHPRPSAQIVAASDFASKNLPKASLSPPMDLDF
ncbi:MAG: hypothetical protein ACI9HK_000758, partial [Pirellulaceae bacterium]